MNWIEHDAELLALRAAGKSKSACARHFGCTRNAISGRLNRLRERAKREAAGETVKLRPALHRKFDTKQMHRPCKAPFEPDESVPDFAWDDAHCAAIMAAGGFTVIPRRAA